MYNNQCPFYATYDLDPIRQTWLHGDIACRHLQGDVDMETWYGEVNRNISIHVDLHQFRN